MSFLRYTFVTDGPTDRALMPILTWLLREQGVQCAIQPAWADLGRLRVRKKLSLVERMRWAVDLYPCDLLFVHRDAERESRQRRYAEIMQAVNELQRDHGVATPAVCVVPVRMQEAWLLFDLEAIRWAAGNSTGRQALVLPPLKDLEAIPNPKKVLHDLLREASGLSGRRYDRFDAGERAVRVPSLIGDFSPLRALPAFSALETDVASLVLQQGWRTLSG
jgi:hypothetical protein